MSINYVFERIEKKYLLTKDDYQILFNSLLSFIEPDQYFSSTVSSLYLDTPDQLIIRNSIDADNYKEKIRLRSYGPANDDTTVFLELKKKLNGIVYKRRVSMSLQDAELYIDKGILRSIMPCGIIIIRSPKCLLHVNVKRGNQPMIPD